MTGGRVVSDDSGLSFDRVQLSDLGRCRRITITENSTTIVGGSGDVAHVEARQHQLEQELTRTEIEHDQDSLTMRIARLAGRVAFNGRPRPRGPSASLRPSASARASAVFMRMSRSPLMNLWIRPGSIPVSRPSR